MNLETERLILTPHVAADFADVAALWAEPEVVRFIGGRPLTSEESWARVLRYAGLWSLLGFGYWAVRERATGRFVGDVGFADFRRLFEPPLGPVPEMGWVLSAWCHGRGYAREAVTAALGWADRHIAAPETTCIIVPEHERSIAVATAVGYEPKGLGAYHERPMAIFTRARRVADDAASASQA